MTLFPRFKAVSIVAVAACIAAACTSEPTCDYSKAPYMAAQSVPALRAPEGLSAPDRTASLVIPPAAADAKPAPTGKGKCLDRPPSYFSTKKNSNEPANPDKESAEKK